MVRPHLGYTIIELAVATMIMLLIVAAAVPFLFHHYKDAFVAEIHENVLNVNTALNVYLSKEGPVDHDGDYDYLDDMVERNYITGKPRIPSCAEWYVRRGEDDEGRKSFFIEIDLWNCPDRIIKLFEYYDKVKDDSSDNDGEIIIEVRE